jgi:septum formation protein
MKNSLNPYIRRFTMELSRPLILASSSPRRQYLMKMAGFTFEVRKPDIDEIFPEDLPAHEVAQYLASLKADYFKDQLQNELVVTADTVVILDKTILNKPADRGEAIEMLSSLSGNTHTVMTGVSILSKEGREDFAESTKVTFEKLTRAQIEYYIDRSKPFDKAGSYGAQDCLPHNMNPCSREEVDFMNRIGRGEFSNELIADQSDDRVVIIKTIAGSYFNVMGLPIHKVYERLRKWQAV